MNLLIICTNHLDGCRNTESVYIDPSMVDRFDLDDQVVRAECNECRDKRIA